MKCRRVKSRVSNKIIGGVNAKIEDVPWQVSPFPILFTDNENKHLKKKSVVGFPIHF